MHLKDNFGEGAPITQVSASWFNRVAKFINNLIPGEGVDFEKHDDGSPTVVKLSSNSTEAGVPVDVGEFPTDEVKQTGEDLWVRGRTDAAGKPIGANLMLVFKGENDGNHLLYAATLMIDPDGRVSKIVAAENGGMEISA